MLNWTNQKPNYPNRINFIYLWKWILLARPKMKTWKQPMSFLNISPIQKHKNQRETSSRSRRERRSACLCKKKKKKPYLAMASSTFVSLPKPFFAFPVKTSSPPLANHKLLGTDTNLKLVKFQAFSVFFVRLMICFSYRKSKRLSECQSDFH